MERTAITTILIVHPDHDCARLPQTGSRLVAHWDRRPLRSHLDIASARVLGCRLAGT